VNPGCVLSLPDDATVAASADGELTLSGSRARVALRRLSPGLRDALHRLVAPGERAERLEESVRAIDGATGLARWYYHLQRLASRQLLRFAACAGADRLASLEPTAPGFVLPSAGALPARSYVLSRFAWMYRRGHQLVLESPLSCARIILHDPRVPSFVHALSRPGTAAEVGARAPGLPAESAAPLLSLLLYGDMARPVDEHGTTVEDTDPALRCWEFHDLLFHSRSRAGRQDGAVGATYPHVDRLDPPQALRPEAETETIGLHRPNLEQLQLTDPPFSRVHEQRRSVREYGAEPITERALGEFLYRVARVRARRELEVETPAGPVRMDFASRPYPAGGGLYELEVYAVVGACRGLDPGLYHYDPLGHRLSRRAGLTAEVQRLLSGAAMSAGVAPERMQVLLVLAARLPRIAWKYTGLAYALVLKDVGVVFQTMYLAATAMGLAPCAVGAGDSDLFARAAGASYYAETAVGEFLLGSSMQGNGDGAEASRMPV
jgi:SagB-type dehydrogenase family enzyme